MHSLIITTGNELIKQFTFDDMKKKYTEQDKETVRALGVVSEDERAVWLIDYWYNKDLKGLIQMPLSRHWIMHIEASLRIKFAGVKYHD